MPIPIQTVESNHIFQDRLDPDGRLDFVVSWAPVLNSNNRKISSAQWTLSAEATSIGVQIASSSFTNTTATVWLEVAQGQRSNIAYDGNGVAVAILLRIEDDNPGMTRRYDRTFGVRIRQL